MFFCSKSGGGESTLSLPRYQGPFRRGKRMDELGDDLRKDIRSDIVYQKWDSSGFCQPKGEIAMFGFNCKLLS